MLPTSPTTVTQTIPSYLYFQYINDPDLPSLISAYNTITQNYVTWFNTVNLPIYSGLSGALLDWIGLGIYGIARPVLSGSSATFQGQIASYTIDDVPISGLDKIQSKEVFQTPDDIYKRIITWAFYRGDGYNFSIPWLKRRIYRFIYGINGVDPGVVFTPEISVTFTETTPIPTCNVVLTGTPGVVSSYLALAMEQNIFGLPFRFIYNVSIVDPVTS